MKKSNQPKTTTLRPFSGFTACCLVMTFFSFTLPCNSFGSVEEEEEEKPSHTVEYAPDDSLDAYYAVLCNEIGPDWRFGNACAAETMVEIIRLKALNIKPTNKAIAKSLARTRSYNKSVKSGICRIDNSTYDEDGLDAFGTNNRGIHRSQKPGYDPFAENDADVYALYNMVVSHPGIKNMSRIGPYPAIEMLQVMVAHSQMGEILNTEEIVMDLDCLGIGKQDS